MRFQLTEKLEVEVFGGVGINLEVFGEWELEAENFEAGLDGDIDDMRKTPDEYASDFIA